jgi:hypothetical protein
MNSPLKESKLRENFLVYYLDNQTIDGHHRLLGEIATAITKDGAAYSVTEEGKVVKLKGKKVYPPEIHLRSNVKMNRMTMDYIEKAYERGQAKLDKLENDLYKKLLPYDGKGKLFIRAEWMQSTDKKDINVFTRVIHVVKGIR